MSGASCLSMLPPLQLPGHSDSLVKGLPAHLSFILPLEGQLPDHMRPLPALPWLSGSRTMCQPLCSLAPWPSSIHCLLRLASLVCPWLQMLHAFLPLCVLFPHREHFFPLLKLTPTHPSHLSAEV